MPDPFHVLMIGFCPADAELCRSALPPMLARRFVELHAVLTIEEAREHRDPPVWDAILCPSDNPALLSPLLAWSSSRPFPVAVVAFGEELEVDPLRSLMGQGLRDVVPRSDVRRLAPVLERELGVCQCLREHDRLKRTLANRINLEKLIAEISSRFINLRGQDVDQEIDRALRLLGEFTGVDRAYVFRFSEDGTRMSNTHEWCAPAIASHRDRLQNIPLGQYPWHTGELLEDRIIDCPEVEALEDRAEAEMAEWLFEGIQSLLVVPMRMEDRTVGFVGLDSVLRQRFWPREASFFLRLVAESFAEALYRCDAEIRRRRTERMYHALLDNSDAVIYLKDASGRYLFVNTAFEQLMKVERGRFEGRTDLDLFDAQTADELRRNDLEVYKGGIACEFEETLSIDGEERTFISLKFPLLGSDNAPSGVGGISTEITQRKQQEQLVLDIARGVSATVGEDFFKMLVERLAKTLGADYTFVGELDPENPGRVRSVAVQVDGKPAENFSYDLSQTPCENVLYRGVCSYPSGVQELFPEDHLLSEMEVNGYMGAPLSDAEGNPLGILVVLYREEVENPALVSNLLQIFAVRAAVELERRRHEERLSASEERFRRYFELGLIGMAITGEDRRWLEVNNYLCGLLGYRREELLGRFWDEVTHPEDLARNLALFEEILAGRRNAYRIDKRMRRKDGVLLDVSVATRCIRKKDGSIDHFISLIQDITERKRAEEGLRKALGEAEGERERTSAILRSVMDGLMVTDLEGRIVLLNAPAEALLGLSSQRLLDRRFTEVISYREIHRLIDAAMEGGAQPRAVDWELESQSGGAVVEVRSSLVASPSGRKLGAVTLFHDVTREREMDRMKQEFISTAAHELRTPLTAILGYAELLLSESEFGEVSSERRKEYLDVIHDKARRLEIITDELLDLSRFQSGQRIALQCSAARLDQLIGQMVGQYRNIAQGHRFELEGCDEIIVQADMGKLEQVMENLLSNAVKFSPQGGAIHVRCRSQEHSVLVEVEDEGIGMTSEQLERVFDKFYRADSSNTAPSGLGLGMSIVRNIIESHGGHIEVESAPGKGTRVAFSLPKTGACPEGEEGLRRSPEDSA